MAQLYLDLDGVFANFEKKAFEELGIGVRVFESKFGPALLWKKLSSINDLFYDLEVIPDSLTLYHAVAHLDPIILTGVPRGGWAEEQKRRWVRDNISQDLKVITCFSKEKCLYCKEGDVLIDDWEKYKHLWESHGGSFIQHISVENSLKQLKELGRFDV